jgi:hypothetical protein
MTNPPSTTKHGRGYRLAGRIAFTTATAAAFVGMATVSASAAPGDDSTANVTANVNVDSTINLALNQTSFTINATPDSTQALAAAVTGTVTTNSATGYNVGVVAEEDTLQPTTGTQSIPIANLQVTDSDGVYAPLSDTAAVITTTKATRSAANGDNFSDDYKIAVPLVVTDLYHVTLNYTATALA